MAWIWNCKIQTILDQVCEIWPYILATVQSWRVGTYDSLLYIFYWNPEYSLSLLSIRIETIIIGVVDHRYHSFVSIGRRLSRVDRTVWKNHWSNNFHYTTFEEMRIYGCGMLLHNTITYIANQRTHKWFISVVIDQQYVLFRITTTTIPDTKRVCLV